MEEKRTSVISVKVTPTLKKKFDSWAWKNHMKQSDAIAKVLVALLEQNEETGEVQVDREKCN